MEFLELAAKRYSCRNLSGEPVPDALVEKIIEAGRLAPTAVDRQPVRIFWMKSPEAAEIIRQVTRCSFGAETFLVVGSCPEEAWVREADNANFSDVDAGIVATHMMMEIEDLGLSTTWVGYFDAPLLQKLCPQMAGLHLIAIFPVGYAAENAVPGPRHSQRKPREELLTVL